MPVTKLLLNDILKWVQEMERIGKLRDSQIPKCQCPWCGHILDRAMSANPKKPNATPRPGDVTICISCAQILVFANDLTVRASAPGEIELTPAMRRAQQAVRELDRRDKTPTTGSGTR